MFILIKLYIWTLSLWDLKQTIKHFISHIFNHLNFVPMGFETIYYWRFCLWYCYLNFVPMGFETIGTIFKGTSEEIWTLSLWDLKRCWNIQIIKNRRIWTLSLWDLKHLLITIRRKIYIYLNFVPMGFETQIEVYSNSCKKYIWTLSLWDLKRLHETSNHVFITIWTLSLWDLKLALKVLFYLSYDIWTLSLWDLKLDNLYIPFVSKLFELCPYGIWNFIIIFP